MKNMRKSSLHNVGSIGMREELCSELMAPKPYTWRLAKTFGSLGGYVHIGKPFTEMIH